MQQIKQLSFSCYDPFDKESESENEDAVNFRQEETFFRAAIADGAGGAGIFCRDWSKFLVEHQPEKPFASVVEANDWFLRISREFYEMMMKRIDATDAFVVEKFHNHGSFATLVFIWWDIANQELYYWGLGDSVLLVFKEREKNSLPKFVFPINEQKRIDQSPRLLNWNRPMDKLDIGRISVREGERVIMATDSMGRWLILLLSMLAKEEMIELLGAELYASVSAERNLIEQLYMKDEFSSVENLLDFIEAELEQSSEVVRDGLMKRIQLGELERDDLTILMCSK